MPKWPGRNGATRLHCIDCDLEHWRQFLPGLMIGYGVCRKCKGKLVPLRDKRIDLRNKKIQEELN